MSEPLEEGQPFPPLLLPRTDGTSLDLAELRKKEHALLLFVAVPSDEVRALIQRYQDEAKTFEWLQCRLIAVFPQLSKIPSPWPAPGYSPFVLKDLPEGLQWDKGYLVSRNRSIFSIYPELPMLSAHKVEQDLLHWEARHCLP